MPIFPPSLTGNLFFFKRCAIILQVVDFPLEPVTTIDLNFLLLRNNKSISVIIFFLNLTKFFLYFVFFKLIPGLKTIKSTSFKDFDKFKTALCLNFFLNFMLSSQTE